MIHIMILADEDSKELYKLILKLEARGYFITKIISPDVSSNSFKESLNALEPEDYLLCVGESVNSGISVLEHKLRSIEAAFFVVNNPCSFSGTLKAKKIFLYGNEEAEKLGDNLDLEAFLDDDLDILLEEVLIDIISLEH